MSAAPSRGPLRVVAVMPEPTPYRSPLFDLLAARDDLDLFVAYSSAAIAGNAWEIAPRHPHRVLRGVQLPGARRLLRHEYPITPGIVAELERRRPACVVLTGWSTFASQCAIVWCRLRRVPYVLIVESHDHGPRSGWRKAVRGAVVPFVIRGAAGVLVTGSLSRASVVARGAPPEGVGTFANTVDVERYRAESARLRSDRETLRAGLGLPDGAIAVLTVARLAPEKGIDTLLRAVAASDDPRLRVLVAGAGPEQAALERLATELRVETRFLGMVATERLLELYVAADLFVLLSRHEPWGVVVNEAAACGLPLVLSDRVGAAHDLLRAGENGALVPADDVPAAAAAIADVTSDPERLVRLGRRSSELARPWGYGPSIEGFLRAVRDAAAAGRRR